MKRTAQSLRHPRLRALILLAVALLLSGCENTNSIYQYPHKRMLSRRFIILRVQCLEIARAGWDDLRRLLTYVDTGPADEQTGELLGANGVIIGPVLHGQKEPAAEAESRLKVIERRETPFYIETGYSREIKVGVRPEGACSFYFTRADGGAVVTRERRRQLNLRLTVLGETERECSVVIQPILVSPARGKLEPKPFKKLTVRLRLWRGRTVYITPSDQRENTLGAYFRSVIHDEPTITVFRISL